MKAFVYLLIFVFSFNLFSELMEGICHESFEIHFSLQKNLTLSLNDNDGVAEQGQSSDCFDMHVCHFGHCGHLIPQEAHLNVESRFLLTFGSRPPLLEVWRHLALPLRPPIS